MGRKWTGVRRDGRSWGMQTRLLGVLGVRGHRKMFKMVVPQKPPS